MSDLLKEFEKEFDKLKKELKFKVSLDELDEVFYVRDIISKDGFVSTSPSKQICRRIIDVYSSWLNYLHGIVMMNGSSLVSMTESTAFSEEEKEKITKLIDRIMILSTEFNLLVIDGDKERTSAFIDEAYNYWTGTLSKELEKILEKTKDKWSDRLKSLPKQKEKESRSIYG